VKNIIKKFGLERTLKSLYPDLKGISFKDVIYDEVLDKTSPISYLTKNIDDKWYFGESDMPMIFKSINLQEKNKLLKEILEINNLKEDDFYYNKSNQDIRFWKGNGFKIEDVVIKNQNIIVITNEETFSKKDFEIKDSNIATKIDTPTWIRGVDKMFDGYSITEKDYLNLINNPLLYKSEKKQHIIIPVSNYDIAKRIIDNLLLHNGGKDNFKLIKNKSSNKWDYFHEGKIFSLGYLIKKTCVKIYLHNQTQKTSDGEILKRGIHSLSDKVNELIKGLNSPIYNPAEGGVPDGRFFTLSEKGNIIASFFTDLETAKGKFDEIVLNYNPKDKILKIKNKSLKDFFEENPKQSIEFKIDGDFEMKLSKDKNLYRINLYPSGGRNNNWDFNKSKIKKNKKIESSANNLFKLKEITNPKFITKSRTDILKEKTFLSQSTQSFIERKKEKKKKNLDYKRKLNLKKINVNLLKKLIRYLVLILAFLFLYKACFYDECSNNAECYFLKAQESENKADFEKALNFYKKAIRVDKNYIDAYNARGLLFQKQKKHNKAISDFSKIIDIDDSNWIAFHNRANSYSELGEKKYSLEYKKAMKDYNKSIKLNSSDKNGISYFNRGLLKEKIEIEACDDFVNSCDRGLTDGCDRYYKICYPKNGDFVLFNEFGKGVFANNGLGKIKLDNSKGKRDLVVVIRKFVNGRRNGPRIRAQFIRKGETIIMNNIPNGYYYTQDYYGEYWIKNLSPKNRFLRKSSFYDYKSNPFNIYNNTMKFTYNVTGGEQGDLISEDDFFK